MKIVKVKENQTVFDILVEQYGTCEALAEFLDWLYEWEFVSGAVTYIKEGNTASRRVAESCGFLHEGRYEGYLVYRICFEAGQS